MIFINNPFNIVLFFLIIINFFMIQLYFICQCSSLFSQNRDFFLIFSRFPRNGVYRFGAKFARSCGFIQTAVSAEFSQIETMKSDRHAFYALFIDVSVLETSGLKKLNMKPITASLIVAASAQSSSILIFN